MAPGRVDLFHVLNPSASRRGGVEACVKAKNWRCVWIDRASHPTHLETVMAWAVNEGVRDVAIWGGDGTFSRAVHALVELNALDKIRLALIPAGTCNDFARKLNLPTWDKLALEAENFAERRIDVGMIEHAEGRRCFINNAGFGRRPEAQVAERPHPIMDIFRLEPTPVAVESLGGAGERRVELRALLGIVFNAPYFGGGLHFSNDVSPEDGRLDGYFVRDQSRWKVLWSFLRARGGRPFSNPRIERVTGEAIRIHTPAWLYPQADGERASIKGVRQITFRVLPGALTLLMPK